MSVSLDILISKIDFSYNFVDHEPATPQRPNPELRIVEPLLISATAASASLNSFDPPRSIFGASDCVCDFLGAVVKYVLAEWMVIGVGRTVVQRKPM